MNLKTVLSLDELIPHETWVVYDNDIALYLGFNQTHNKTAFQYESGILYENADETKRRINQGLMSKVEK